MENLPPPLSRKVIRGPVGRLAGWLAAGIAWRARALWERMRYARTTLGLSIRLGAGFSQPEAELIRDAQRYWNDPPNPSLKQNSHWRGVGIFADDARWLELGREHLRLYQELARSLGRGQPVTRMVEWGCGGGMNAVHFGRQAREFYGVDIAPASLEECARQMQTAGLTFTPVLIDAARPEAALPQIPGPCDLYISTYVFELVPTPEYGVRLLRIAHQLLAPGGLAFIQIKYSEGDVRTASRRWGYVKNLAWNATYRIEAFWLAAVDCGFTPKLVSLVPKQPAVSDRNYAYFLLVK